MTPAIEMIVNLHLQKNRSQKNKKSIRLQIKD